MSARDGVDLIAIASTPLFVARWEMVEVMSKLKLEPNVAMPDDLYEAIVGAHHGLTLAQSQDLNARLVLLLANHIGDVDVVRQALARARETIVETPSPHSGSNEDRGTKPARSDR